jgi:hypothetical protein
VDQEGKSGFFKCSRHGRGSRCPGVAIHRTLTQRRALVAKRKELRALPVEPKVQIIETGETYGELWRRQDLDGRRSLLASVLDEVRVLKGRRGGAPSMRQPVRDRAGLVWKGMARAS